MPVTFIFIQNIYIIQYTQQKSYGIVGNYLIRNHSHYMESIKYINVDEANEDQLFLHSFLPLENYILELKCEYLLPIEIGKR